MTARVLCGSSSTLDRWRSFSRWIRERRRDMSGPSCTSEVVDEDRSGLAECCRLRCSASYV